MRKKIHPKTLHAMKRRTPRIVSMYSPGSGNPVPNQIKIYTDDGVWFESYGRKIVFKPYGYPIILDEFYWDYSVTTGKYRNQFLGEGITETRRKIEDDTYMLADLN